jgi:hypothetical protein
VRRAPAILVLLFLAVGGLVAQQTPPPTPQAPAPPPPDERVSGQTIRVPVNLVNIIATVVTRREKLVTDLEKPEFRVFEQNWPSNLAIPARRR